MQSGKCGPLQRPRKWPHRISPHPDHSKDRRGTDTKRAKGCFQKPFWREEYLFTDVEEDVQLSGIIARRGAFGVVR